MYIYSRFTSAMKSDIYQIEVKNNLEKQRFEARVGNQLAVARYTLGKEHIIFAQTEIPEELKGQTVESTLIYTALEYAKKNGLGVMLVCPCFAAYIRRHPEYKALLRPGFQV